MNVKIENEYVVLVSKYESRTFTDSFENVIKDYREWLNEDTLESEEALRADFIEYIVDNCEIIPENFGPDVELYEYS